MVHYRIKPIIGIDGIPIRFDIVMITIKEIECGEIMKVETVIASENCIGGAKERIYQLRYCQ